MIPRALLSRIQYLLGLNAAVVILGPRQVSKTPLARQIATTVPTIYLDLQDTSAIAKLEDARSFLAPHLDKLVILDEVQLRPALFPILRGLIDQARREGRGTGRYLILGSASYELLRQSSESLAGRVSYCELSPLLATEIPATTDAVDRLWVRGGFPLSYAAKSDADSMTIRLDFVRSYLDRDVREFAPGISKVTLDRFWRMLAHSQAAEWNGAKLAAGLGVSGHAVTRYRDLLTDLLLVRQLAPWTGNVKKRLIKSPKIYIRDSGLCHALVGVTSRDQLLGHPVVGGGWEGFVIENILNTAPEVALTSFYRSASGDEIDLVLECGSHRLAVEIKRSMAPSVEPGFYRACAAINATEQWVVYPGHDLFQLRGGATSTGLTALMQRVGQL
jgi:uncharacterized protein